MKNIVLKLVVTCCLIFALLLPCNSQDKKLFEGCGCSSKDNETVEKLFVELKNHEQLAAQCERKEREEQLAKSGNVLRPISGFCGGGCAVSLALPRYSSDAIRLKIFGLVKVEVVVDEQGNVAYARVLKGSSFF